MIELNADMGIMALVIFVSLVAVWLIFYFIPIGLWFSALVSGVRVSGTVTSITSPRVFDAPDASPEASAVEPRERMTAKMQNRTIHFLFIVKPSLSDLIQIFTAA